MLKPEANGVVLMAKQTLADFMTNYLHIENFPMTAITGGGGKTSLMFALSGLLEKKGRVVATTTTKIAIPRGDEYGCLFIGDSEETVGKIAALPRRGAITVVRESRGAKLYGFTPRETDLLLKSGEADWIVVEADGSRNLPLKAYEEWEPPVPELATLQFVMIGADAFIEPLGDETAFRYELLRERFGAERGEKLPPRKAARILSDRNEYLKNSPPQARRVLILNKTELLSEAELAEILSGLAEVAGYDVLAALSLKNRIVYETLILCGKGAET